jgi:hypothetical protein
VIAALDASGQPIGDGAWYVAPGGELLVTLPKGGPYQLHALTFTGTAAPDFETCGVALGGQGDLLPTPSASWVSDPIRSAGDHVAFHSIASTNALGLRFKSAACRTKPTAPTFCDHYTLEVQDLRALSPIRPYAVAMISPTEALIAASDQGRPATGAFYTVKKGNAPELLWSGRANLPASVAYAGSGTVAFGATPEGIHILDLKTRARKLRSLQFYPTQTVVTSVSSVLWWVDGVDAFSVLGFAAGSTVGEERRDLKSGPHAIAAPDSGRVIELFGTGSSTTAGPALLHWLHDGVWSDETDVDWVVDRSSRVAIGTHGAMITAGDPASYVPPHGDTIVHYLPLPIGSPAVTVPVVTQGEAPAIAAADDGFFVATTGLFSGTVKGFSGQALCDFSESSGQTLVAPFDMAWDPVSRHGAWVGWDQLGAGSMIIWVSGK